MIVVAILAIPFLISRFLTTVEAGIIRLVSWFKGGTVIYKGTVQRRGGRG